MNRRTVLRALAALPIVGALTAIVSPLYRVLRPTAGPFDFFRPPDVASAEAQVVGKASDLAELWSFTAFEFVQKNVEYTPQGVQESRIPGFVVRVTPEIARAWGYAGGQFIVISRICTHLGCVFNYVPDTADISTGYNFRPSTDAPHFGCPCHLSVYDIVQGGKVVSGPAPRAPRKFEFIVEGDDIRVTSLEAGGVA